ncbi:MAG TPA: hypothetical protein VGN42_16000 [Pirellulales bacterium]|nr:hypothetical protein [Pirellulales bacterium]
MLVTTELKDAASGEDCGERKPVVKATIEVGDNAIMLGFDGYGDFSSSEGSGRPILVENYRGEIRLIVFADINNQEPTNVIELRGALESIRQESQSGKQLRAACEQAQKLLRQGARRDSVIEHLWSAVDAYKGEQAEETEAGHA